MNKKSVIFPFVVWIAVAAISPLYSQSAGFQIRQSQPANPPSPSTLNLIAPIGSPIQPTANPILPLIGTNSLQQTKAVSETVSGFGNGAITILPAGSVVFVPAGTLVIEKDGNPIAFILNMNGETLYFKGGAVVFIKDGVVAVPAVADNSTRR
jgi:hypothetical protein